MKPTPKEFALAQIAPYYKDPSTCGVDEENQQCCYLTEDGRKCVIGKNLLHPEYFFQNDNADLSIVDILEEFGEKRVLIPEAIGILTIEQWESLQELHDAISGISIDSIDIDGPIIGLGLFTKEELIEYCKTH